MDEYILDSEKLGELRRKYYDAKRKGWSVANNRRRDNQTIEVNRAEVLKVINSAEYAESLFQVVYYLEQLVGAIADCNSELCSIDILDDFRKCWIGQQVTPPITEVSDETVAHVKSLYPHPDEVGPIEQTILFVLQLQIKKEYKDTILQALFQQITKSQFHQGGRLKCGNCYCPNDILDLLEQGVRVAYCRRCGQRIL